MVFNYQNWVQDKDQTHFQLQKNLAQASSFFEFFKYQNLVVMRKIALIDIVINYGYKLVTFTVQIFLGVPPDEYFLIPIL